MKTSSAVLAIVLAMPSALFADLFPTRHEASGSVYAKIYGYSDPNFPDEDSDSDATVSTSETWIDAHVQVGGRGTQTYGHSAYASENFHARSLDDAGNDVPGGPINRLEVNTSFESAYHEKMFVGGPPYSEASGSLSQIIEFSLPTDSLPFTYSLTGQDAKTENFSCTLSVINVTSGTKFLTLSDGSRVPTTLATIVGTPGDLIRIEASGAFQGQYLTDELDDFSAHLAFGAPAPPEPGAGLLIFSGAAVAIVRRRRG